MQGSEEAKQMRCARSYCQETAQSGSEFCGACAKVIADRATISDGMRERSDAAFAPASAPASRPGREEFHRSQSLEEIRAKRRETVDRFGALPYRIGPVVDAIKESTKDGARETVRKTIRAFDQNFPRFSMRVDEPRTLAKVVADYFLGSQ